MARPSRSNAYTHPAKVLLEGKIKLQTPAEKRAHDAAAAEKNWSEAARVEKEHEDGIKCIAAMEDSLKRDDRNYGKDAPPYRPQADASTHKAKGYYSVAKGQVALQVSQTWDRMLTWFKTAASDDEEPESDEAYQPSDSESENSKSKGETDDDSDVGEPEEYDGSSSVEGVHKCVKGKKCTVSKEKVSKCEFNW